jgi:hypothetical protein
MARPGNIKFVHVTVALRRPTSADSTSCPFFYHSLRRKPVYVLAFSPRNQLLLIFQRGRSSISTGSFMMSTPVGSELSVSQLIESLLFKLGSVDEKYGCIQVHGDDTYLINIRSDREDCTQANVSQSDRRLSSTCSNFRSSFKNSSGN